MSGAVADGMKLTSLPFALLIAPAIAACVDDPDLAVDEIEITNAPDSTAHEESVRLDLLGVSGECTGLAISPHWVLTAAHCTKTFTNGTRLGGVVRVYATNKSYDEVQIYGLGGAYADAMFIRHPSWNGTGEDKNDDVALIKLYGRGMSDGDTIDPFSARIFWDSREPWKASFSGNRDFQVAGYGLGGGVGDPANCETAGGASDGMKRLGTFRLDPTIPNYSSTYTAKAVTPYGQDICGGDSGAPWLLNRTGWYAFAIHSGQAPEPELGGPEFGTLIRPKMAWIESTAAARLPALSCSNYVWNGWTYRQCDE